MNQPMIFIITDIEADGPDPGRNSMLAFASVTRDAYGKEHGEFTANLKPLPDAAEDPGTMRWWQSQPQAWEQATHNQQAPEDVIPAWIKWVQGRPGIPVFTAHPLSFDGAWIDYYLQRCKATIVQSLARSRPLLLDRALIFPLSSWRQPDGISSIAIETHIRRVGWANMITVIVRSTTRVGMRIC